MARAKKSIFRRILWLTFTVVLVCAAVAALRGWNYASIYYLESTPPELAFVSAPLGIGLDAKKVSLVVKDSGAGLDEILVRFRQGSENRILLKQQLGSLFSTQPRTHEAQLEFELPGKEPWLRQAEAQLSVTAFDRSLRGNKSALELKLPVSFSRPEISAISPQHNAVAGGTQLAIYRQHGGLNVESGVQVGERFFKGYPARLWDPAFAREPDIYFALFAIPLSGSEPSPTPRLLAKDQIGNTGTSGIHFRLRNARPAERQLALSREFIRGTLQPLLLRRQQLPESAIPSEAQVFERVNQGFRQEDERILSEVFARSSPERYWQGNFARAAGRQVAGFGDRRSYTLEGVSIGSSQHWGVDLASTQQMPIFAANSGKVAYVGELAVYGSTVVIDHGFGLSTLYAHLSSTQVSLGQSLAAGEQLGRSGASGLAEGDHLHFEIRVQGVPVLPIEWWDGRWVQDHVERKLEAAKKLLGIG
jgi:murein DD-endopeptidase MepM/ murein hydrolase activator NlpD